MNADMIFVDYNPFDLESRFTIVKDGIRHTVGAPSNFAMLTDSLFSLAQSNNVYNVKVHAPVSIFYELERQIKEAEKNTYGENKIKMEIC